MLTKTHTLSVSCRLLLHKQLVPLNLLLLWLPVYGALALRRVYGQSWGKSLLKAFLMLNVYGVILAFAAVLGVAVTLISILITL